MIWTLKQQEFVFEKAGKDIELGRKLVLLRHPGPDFPLSLLTTRANSM
jgi:hypothetical protein